MSYTLQKLNVVKTVERADKRDALLAQGFKEIEVVSKKENGKSNKSETPKNNDSENGVKNE